MSVTITLDIMCDNEDCMNWMHGTVCKLDPVDLPYIVDGALHRARLDGWFVRDEDFAFCPDCAKKKFGDIKMMCSTKNYLGDSPIGHNCSFWWQGACVFEDRCDCKIKI